MNRPDISKFQAVRKKFLKTPHYTLSFRDQLYLSEASCSALASPSHVIISYDMNGQTITIRKATTNEAILWKEKPSNPNIAIGTVRSNRRIVGVRRLQRLIQQEMKNRFHFHVLGSLEEDCLVFDLHHAFYRAARAGP